MAGGPVKIPGIGTVKREHLYAGGALVAGIVGYAWWRARSAEAGAAAGEELPADDYGSDYASTAPGGSPGGGPTTGAGGGAVVVPPSGPVPPRTNAEWSKAATDYLASIGYEAAPIAGVLGKYLGRQQLTPAEADLVRTALGSMGPPPIGEFSVIMIPAPTVPSAPVPPKPTTPTTPAPTTPVPPKPVPPKPPKPPTAPKPPTTPAPAKPVPASGTVILPGDPHFEPGYYPPGVQPKRRSVGAIAPGGSPTRILPGDPHYVPGTYPAGVTPTRRS